MQFCPSEDHFKTIRNRFWSTFLVRVIELYNNLMNPRTIPAIPGTIHICYWHQLEAHMPPTAGTSEVEQTLPSSYFFHVLISAELIRTMNLCHDFFDEDFVHGYWYYTKNYYLGFYFLGWYSESDVVHCCEVQCMYLCGLWRVVWIFRCILCDGK